MFKKLSLLSLVLALASCGTFSSNNSSKKEEVAAKPVVVETLTKKAEEEKLPGRHVVYFDTNKSELTQDALKGLEGTALPMVKEVVKSSNGSIVIEGHCDERGSKSYNKKLGKKRAEAVKAYFVKNGVKASKITVKSYGKALPVDTAHTEEAWAKNRRAVTVSVKM